MMYDRTRAVVVVVSAAAVEEDEDTTRWRRRIEFVRRVSDGFNILYRRENDYELAKPQDGTKKLTTTVMI